MATITIKGHTFEAVLVRDSASRRAVQYRNNIVIVLGKIGVVPDNVVIDIEPMAMKNLPAVAIWYKDGYRMYYSYKLAKKYVDNLYVVFKVIEAEVLALMSGRRPLQEFCAEFTEEEEVEDHRKQARVTLGVAHDVVDFEHIDKKYKELAKAHHPDMPGGNADIFKKINDAHKTLRRELK